MAVAHAIPAKGNRKIAEPSHTSCEINALEMGVPFSICAGRSNPVRSEFSHSCPEVTLAKISPDHEILIDGRTPSDSYFDWRPITGASNQYNYYGAILHPSEFVGSNLTRRLVSIAAIAEPTGTEIFVITEVINEDDPDHLVGWVILHKLDIIPSLK